MASDLIARASLVAMASNFKLIFLHNFLLSGLAPEHVAGVPQGLPVPFGDLSTWVVFEMERRGRCLGKLVLFTRLSTFGVFAVTFCCSSLRP